MISLARKSPLPLWLSMAMALILSHQGWGIETSHKKVAVEDVNVQGHVYSWDYERFILVRLSDTDPWYSNPAMVHMGSCYWGVNSPLCPTLEVRIYDEQDNDVTDQFFNTEQVMPLYYGRRPFHLSPIAFAHYADGLLDLPLPVGSYDVVPTGTGLDEARTYRHVFVRVSHPRGPDPPEGPIPAGEYTVVVTYTSQYQTVEKGSNFMVVQKTVPSVTRDEAAEKVNDQIGTYIGYPVQIYAGETPYWAVNVFNDAAKTELRGTAVIHGIGGGFVSPDNTPWETINDVLLVAVASDDFTSFGQDPLAEGFRQKWLNAAEGEPNSFRSDYEKWLSLAGSFYAEHFRNTMYKCLKYQAGALLQLVGAGSSIPAFIVDNFILPAAEATGFVETNPINLLFGDVVNDFDKGQECSVASEIAYQQWQLALHVEYLLNSHIQYAAKSVSETEELLRCMDALNELEIQRLRSSMRYMCYVREDNDGDPDKNPDYDVSPAVFDNLAGGVGALKALGPSPTYDGFRSRASERVLLYARSGSFLYLDLNGDKTVNFSDFSILASRWLATCSYPDWCEATDLDWSGQVDFGDVKCLAKGWLCRKPFELVGRFPITGKSKGLAVQGNYAYVVAWYDGLEIIDISNPATPFGVAHYPIAYYPLEVAVSGRYAYIADCIAGGGSLVVVDVLNPEMPAYVGACSESIEPEGIFLAGNYAYVASYTGGLLAVDVSNPSAPFLADDYYTGGLSLGVTVSGRYAYVADGPEGLKIIDISDPASLQYVNGCDTPGWAEEVAVSGNYAYVADYDGGIQIIDVSNPSSPSVVNTYNTTGLAHDIIVVGSYAYIADYQRGLIILDVSNPASPQYVGWYQTSGAGECVAVVGNYIYFVDTVEGLLIFTLP